MPLHLHDKEHVLDACLRTFARHGYGNTTTAMLAEAAGTSKALIFHHFKSKSRIYLELLDRCAALARAQLDPAGLTRHHDFFEARERFSQAKLEFVHRHPDVYRVLKEAYLAPPEELHDELARRQHHLNTERRDIWRRLFAKVPLRKGVDRSAAFELVMLAIDHFEQKYLSEMTDETELDPKHVRRFLRERGRFLEMIRHGIAPEEYPG